MMTESPKTPNSTDADPVDLNHQKLVVVARRANEIAAAVVVDCLTEAGIRSTAVGGYVAGFRAEAPGEVEIKTMQFDADRARKVIAELRPID